MSSVQGPDDGPDREVPAGDPAGPGRPGGDDLRGSFARMAGSSLRTDGAGRIDVLAAIGGPRGIVEAVLPGLVFLTVFTFARALTPALVSAIAVAVVFTVWRLVERRPVVQAVSGLVGVAICALFADVSDQPLNYYVPGFWTNLVSIVVLIVSVVARWPLVGVVFGLLRNEGSAWRTVPQRARAYRRATWLLIGMFALRLVVQYPLYLAGNLVALGTTRLLMGVPLYALTLWVAWLISRPTVTGPRSPRAPR
ncbi:hypothetical protein GCM10011512_27880 [Tersicoccus solisilvae]|uniref:DUF3159 domain-containing protein n=1 Tax=Tersicoccus solisilvae TaxID=1882339 RepID=A0ABQ1PLY6_9MICC|nr:DUF3159 domain-containing protein [Tersicoccus solisilvae]GGC99379.1 hypothetical protein GCM10011512_27880 [Tersicoccus solisilvae]